MLIIFDCQVSMAEKAPVMVEITASFSAVRMDGAVFMDDSAEALGCFLTAF